MAVSRTLVIAKVQECRLNDVAFLSRIEEADFDDLTRSRVELVPQRATRDAVDLTLRVHHANLNAILALRAGADDERIRHLPELQFKMLLSPTSTIGLP